MLKLVWLPSRVIASFINHRWIPVYICLHDKNGEAFLVSEPGNEKWKLLLVIEKIPLDLILRSVIFSSRQSTGDLSEYVLKPGFVYAQLVKLYQFW